MEQSRYLAIGLDLGGKKILAALISRDGEIFGEYECQAATKEQSDASRDSHFAINGLLAETATDRSLIKGIGWLPLELLIPNKRSSAMRIIWD